MPVTGPHFHTTLANWAGFQRRDLGLKAQVTRSHEPQSAIVRGLGGGD